MCPQCGSPLKDSQCRRNFTFKSCPQCSERLGVHAYYPYDHFGMRMNGEVIQSWCPDCRGRNDYGQPTFLCS